MPLFGGIGVAIKKVKQAAIDSVVNLFDTNEDNRVSAGEVVRKGNQLFQGNAKTQSQQYLSQKKAETGKVTAKDVLLSQPATTPKLRGTPPSTGLVMKGAQELVVKPMLRAGASVGLSLGKGKKTIEQAPLTKSLFGSGYAEEAPGEVVSLQEQTRRAKAGEGEIGKVASFLQKKTGLSPSVTAVPLIGLVTIADLFPENPLKATKALKTTKVLSKLTKFGDETLNTAMKLAEDGGQVEKVSSDVLQNITKAISEEAGMTPSSAVLSPKKPGVVRTGEDVLKTFSDKIKYTTPNEKPKLDIPRLFQQGKEKVESAFLNQYAALDTLQKNVLKSAGKPRQGLKLSEVAEQFAGVHGKQQLDQIRFMEDVVNPIKQNYKEFNEYLALRRTLARTETGKIEARVADFTKDEIVGGLKALHDKVGPETFNTIEVAANAFQRKAKESLALLRNAGILSDEAVTAIAKSSDFYAPFRVMKYVDEGVEEAARTGRSLEVRSKDLLKTLKGIDDKGFELLDPTATMASQLARVRAIAEKNQIMQRFTDLAKLDEGGRFIRPFKSGEKVPKDFGVIDVFEKGKKVEYLVPESVAKAVSGFNEAQMNLFKTVLSVGSKPFRFGAITANVGFQIGNLLFADIPRNIIMNKFYGLDPTQLVRFPLDFMRGFWSSVSLSVPGMTPNKLAREFLESGAAGSTVARVLQPGAFVKGEKAGLTKRLLREAPGAAFDAASNTFAKLGDIVETTSKITGFQAGKRAIARGKTTMEEVVKEVRRYAGSPDFARRGQATQDFNLLFMFFNARLQGVSADLARLQPFTMKEGSKVPRIKRESAEAWAKLTAGVGMPALGLAIYNMKDENREDFEKIPQWERDNYFMIPKSLLYGKDDPRSYFTNEDGERLRDYWKIQKRETVKLVANMIEDGYRFTVDKDPKIAQDLAVEFLEGIAPVNIEGDTLRERGLSVIGSTNPVFKVPTETLFGISSFTKRDIIPEYINGVRTADLMRNHPDLVYKDSTPDVYVSLGHDLNMSPLIIEHVVNGFTGGLAGDFTKDPSVTGSREVQNQGTLFRRFNRSPFTEQTPEEKAMLEQVGTVRSDEAAEDLSAAQKAGVIFRQMSTAGSADDIVPLLEGIDEDTKKELRDLIEREALGLNYTEQQVKNLPSNEEKAEFIYMNLQTFVSGEQVSAFLADMENIGVLTDGVREQLRNLIADEARQ